VQDAIRPKRSEPAKKSGQNIPKNRCRTTIPERMVETLAELPFIGNQVVFLSHDQAARSGPAFCQRASPRKQPKLPLGQWRFKDMC
jgi:hypothetical protein